MIIVVITRSRNDGRETKVHSVLLQGFCFRQLRYSILAQSTSVISCCTATFLPRSVPTLFCSISYYLIKVTILSQLLQSIPTRRKCAVGIYPYGFISIQPRFLNDAAFLPEVDIEKKKCCFRHRNYCLPRV